jgi:hypothetical protein
MAGIQLAPPPNPYSDQLAQALMAQGMDNSQPIVTPLQGIGKLVQALTGAYLHKQYGDQTTKYQQQHRDALTHAVMQALYPQQQAPITGDPNTDTGNIAAGNGLSVNPINGQQTQPQSLPPEAALLQSLMNDPSTQDQANQLGVQMAMEKSKNQPNETWVDLSQADKEKRGYNPYQAIREKYIDGKATGETQAVGSPTFDPTVKASQVSTNTYADDGSYVKRTTFFNKKGDPIGQDEQPQVEKAMPPLEQNKVDAIIKTAGISSVMRDILTAGAQTGWTGPVSGPLDVKLQNMGIDAGGTYAQAFAALKDHYVLALNGLVPQRGKWILETLQNLGPKPQYSLQRDLTQLDLTDGLVKNSAANTVQGFTNTGYHLDPTLIDIAKEGGFDPNKPHSAIKNYLPDLASKATQTIPEGQTATGKNGEKIIVKNGQWVDINTGRPYGG